MEPLQTGVTMRARLRLLLTAEKETRPLIKDVADDVLHSFIEQRLEQRISCYSQAMYHLPTSNLSNENFQRILKRHAK